MTQHHHNISGESNAYNCFHKAKPTNSVLLPILCWRGAFTLFTPAVGPGGLCTFLRLLSSSTHVCRYYAYFHFHFDTKTVLSVIGLAEDCLFLIFYRSQTEYASLEKTIFTINVAWGWYTFALNSILTLAIIYKIMSVPFRICIDDFY